MPRLAPHWRTFLRCGVALSAVAMVICLASSAGACPTCKEDLANNPQGQGLARGFYYSILLMMSAPFAVMGMLGFVFYRSIKRAQLERDAAAASSAVEA